MPTLTKDAKLDPLAATHELRTKLKIAGNELSVGDLLGSGAASATGDNIVAKSLGKLQEIRTAMESLIGIYDQGNATLRSQLRTFWTVSAQAEVNKIFGAGNVSIGSTPDEDDILDEMGDLISALSSEAAFAAATEKDGRGVFASAALGADAAAKAFAATPYETSVRLGVTGDTRYGAVYKQERENATDDLAYRYFLPSVLVDTTVDTDGANSTNADKPLLEIYVNDSSVDPNFAGESLQDGTSTTVVHVTEGSKYNDDHIATGDIDGVEAAIRATVLANMNVANNALTNNDTQTQELDVKVTAGSSSGTYSVQVQVVTTTTATGAQATASRGTPFTVKLVEVYTPPDASTGDGQVGAFSWATIPDTVRTRHIQSTGNAYYEGGTRAVSGKGVHYAGDISLRVRFATNKVNGLITNLVDDEGQAWDYAYGEADSIILPTATLAPAATWTTAANAKAEVTFAARAGSPRPEQVDATFAGYLLGVNDDAGSQAVGTWSLGKDPRKGDRYLAGAFGAVQTSDEPDATPGTDQGGGIAAMINSSTSAKLADGKLTLTVNRYGWNWAANDTAGTSNDTSDDVLKYGADIDSTATNQQAAKWHYGIKLKTDDDNRNILDATPSDVDDDPDQSGDQNFVIPTKLERTLEVGLEALFAKDGGELNTNGSKHVDDVRTELEALRTRLSALIDIDLLPTEQESIWQDVQDVLQTRLFNKVPAKLNDSYDKDEALGLIDRVLDALSSQTALAQALEKDGVGIFTDGGTPISTRTIADIWGERETQVKARLGATNYTRFGAWRVRNTKNALRSGGWQNRTGADKDGPGVFAYSPEDPTVITEIRDQSYPGGGSGTYTGGTRAIQGTVIYEGEVVLTANWDDAAVSGSISMQISNLRNAGNGDPLTYSVYEDAAGAYSETASTRTLGDLIFADNITAAPDSSDQNRLKFSNTGDSLSTASSIAVRVGSTDPGIEQVALVFQDSNDTADTDRDTGMVEGMFVGRVQEGPRGVIGRWEVMAKGVNIDSNDNITQISNGSNVKIGNGTLLQGAFGAELP